MDRIPRILTIHQRREHIDKYATPDMEPGHRELLGDIATTESNYFHNTLTGFQEFFPDTPEWIVDIARLRNWITTRENIVAWDSNGDWIRVRDEFGSIISYWSPKHMARQCYLPVAFREIPNVHLWELYKGSPVKLTLRPGQSIELYEFSKHEEGFSSTYTKFTHRGDRIVQVWDNKGRDCDGRHGDSGKCYCRIDRVGTMGDHPNLPGFKCSPWEKHTSQVYDQFAEAAGY